MRIVYAAFLLLLVTGCSQPYVNFSIEAPQISNGVFTVYGEDGNAMYGANFKNGKLEFDHQYLKQSGYYTFKLAESGKQPFMEPAEIYLEPGDYHIKVEERG